jgi:DNA modification methylase
MKWLDMLDMDIDDWRNSDLTTSALWIDSVQDAHVIPRLAGLPKRDQDFHGIFIPYIPYQFIRRFTKPGEVVWDCFAGSGTTHRVAELLARKCISNDVYPQHDFIQQGNSMAFDPGCKVQLVFMHPPYYNIVDYGTKALGSSGDLNDFLIGFEAVMINVVRHLDDDRMLVLVCGNVFLEGEEITLGCICKDIVRSFGFRLRSHIIKSYGETKAGTQGRNANLQHYRGLRMGFNSFYGDNIFLLQKRPSKWYDQEIA